MNINRLFSRLLLFVIPLYFTQGWLFGSGSITSQLLIGVWLLIDFYYMFIYLLKGRRNTISNFIIVFWIVNFFYWLFSPKEVHALGLSFNTFGDFKNLSTVVLSFFPFAVLTKKRIIDDRFLRRFAIFFLVAAIVAYMTKAGNNAAEFGIQVTNNTAYYFAVILPLLGVFFGEKKFWIGYLLITVFLLLCAKRGAIICAVLSLLVYFSLSMKSISVNKVLSRIIGMVVILTILSIIVINIFSSSELLQSRLIDTQEGNSSARDIIYAELWDVFLNSNMLKQVFGHGMSQTVSFVGGYAHNDWLELLTNEGVFGILFYGLVFLSFISYYHKNKDNMSVQFRFILLTALWCYLFRSIFSMGFLAPESALFFIAMGYAQNANGGV